MALLTWTNPQSSNKAMEKKHLRHKKFSRKSRQLTEQLTATNCYWVLEESQGAERPLHGNWWGKCSSRYHPQGLGPLATSGKLRRRFSTVGRRCTRWITGHTWKDASSFAVNHSPNQSRHLNQQNRQNHQYTSIYIYTYITYTQAPIHSNIS